MCDYCGDWVAMSTLVRKRMRWLQPQGRNDFPYSEYDGTNFWVCGATYDGRTSIGTNAMAAHAIVNADNTVTNVDGSPTFTGSGTIRSTDATDISAWTSFVMAAEVGTHQQSQSSLTIVLGLANSDGSVLTPLRTFTSRGNKRRVWVTANIADLGAYATSTAYFYITTTVSVAGSKWFIDSMQLEKDATTPGQYVKTTGAATTYATDAMAEGMLVVCPKCRMPLVPRSKLRGIPHTEPQPIIPIMNEEV